MVYRLDLVKHVSKMVAIDLELPPDTTQKIFYGFSAGKVAELRMK